MLTRLLTILLLAGCSAGGRGRTGFGGVGGGGADESAGEESKGGGSDADGDEGARGDGEGIAPEGEGGGVGVGTEGGAGDGVGEGADEGAEGEGAEEGAPNEGVAEGAEEGAPDEGDGEGADEGAPGEGAEGGAAEGAGGEGDLPCPDDPIGDSCDTGQRGPCWQGRIQCVDGEPECVGVVDPLEEVCDGLDNDCDGEADEGRPESDQRCRAEVPGECEGGLTVCEVGVLRCVGVDPVDEVCDSLDNDCDGEVDEDLDAACETGEDGVCGAGVASCVDGDMECERQVGPSDEQCDRLDNDCDGEIDEDDGQGACSVCGWVGCPVVGWSGGVSVYSPALQLLQTFAVGSVQSVAASTDGTLHAGRSGSAVSIDVRTGQTTDRAGFSGSLYGVSVSPDGARLLGSGSGMQGIRQVALPGGGGLAEIPSPNGSNLRCTGWNPDGWLYLTSFSNGPVQAWDPQGDPAGPFGGGGLSTAFGVATNSVGEVFVASQNNARYYVFASADAPDAHGFLRSVAVDCQGQLRNVAVDGDDHVWIACYGSGAVVRFSPEGREVARIQAQSPAGVAVTYEFPAIDP